MKSLLSFSGRMARMEFFLAQLAALIIMVFAAIVAGLFGNVVGERDLFMVFLGGPVFVLGMWVFLTTSIQRLHDIGLSGWHLLWMQGIGVVASTVPNDNPLAMILNLVSFVISLYMLFTPGQDKENAFGPVPA